MKIHRATPHNESCGALRKFCALTSLRFHGNTLSITAKRHRDKPPEVW